MLPGSSRSGYGCPKKKSLSTAGQKMPSCGWRACEREPSAVQHEAERGGQEQPVAPRRRAASEDYEEGEKEWGWSATEECL